MKSIKWFSLFASTAYGLSLSYMFQAHEPRACFYIDIPHTSSELSAYFAVQYYAHDQFIIFSIGRGLW